MTVRELTKQLVGLPLDAEVLIGFTEEILEDGGWQEYDSDAPVASVEFDEEENTITLKEARED